MLTDKQLSYIKVLEHKSNLVFTGITSKDMDKFIERANQVIEERELLQKKLNKDYKRFPYPDLKNELPTAKQWKFIRLLEEKSNVKFDGVTRNDAKEYIDKVLNLI